jgi:hypothetical protein
MVVNNLQELKPVDKMWIRDKGMCFNIIYYTACQGILTDIYPCKHMKKHRYGQESLLIPVLFVVSMKF